MSLLALAENVPTSNSAGKKLTDFDTRKRYIAPYLLDYKDVVQHSLHL